MTVACYPITVPIRSAVPTFEPVTLDEARHQCNLSADGGNHDKRLTSFIQLSREQVEQDTGLVCCTGTYTFKRTEWPQGDWFELSSVRPVTSITSITYVATDGDTDTWSSAEYALDTYAIGQIVRLKYGFSWPTIRGDISGITITAVAGYATAETVPQRVKDAVLMYLKAQWLYFMEQDASAAKHIEAYERMAESLARSVYG